MAGLLRTLGSFWFARRFPLLLTAGAAYRLYKGYKQRHPSNLR